MLLIYFRTTQTVFSCKYIQKDLLYGKHIPEVPILLWIIEYRRQIFYSLTLTTDVHTWYSCSARCHHGWACRVMTPIRPRWYANFESRPPDQLSLIWPQNIDIWNVIHEKYFLKANVRLGVTLGSKPLPLSIVARKYFIKICSFIALQALQVCKLVMANRPSTGNPNYSVMTYVPHWSQFGYDRNITVHLSSYKALIESQMFYIGSIKYRPVLACVANHFQCDDGTCSSQQKLCNWPNKCSPSSCVCWVKGNKVHDIYYCQDMCLLGTCSCPKHHF